MLSSGLEFFYFKKYTYLTAGYFTGKAYNPVWDTSTS